MLCSEFTLFTVGSRKMNPIPNNSFVLEINLSGYFITRFVAFGSQDNFAQKTCQKQLCSQDHSGQSNKKPWVTGDQAVFHSVIHMV